MTEPLQFRNWIREAREHWKEHRPNEYRRLQQGGKLESALREAAEATADEMATLTEQGFDHHQAWEMVRETYLYLPQEPRHAVKRGKEKPETGDLHEAQVAPATRYSLNPSEAGTKGAARADRGHEAVMENLRKTAAEERQARMEKVADGMQASALRNFDRLHNEQIAREEASMPAAATRFSQKPPAARSRFEQIGDRLHQQIMANLRQAAREYHESEQELTVESRDASTASQSEEPPWLTEIADQIQQRALANFEKAADERRARTAAWKSAPGAPTSEKLAVDRIAAEWQELMLSNFRKAAIESRAREQATTAASATPSSKNPPAAPTPFAQIADEWQEMMLSNLRQASAERKARKQEMTGASAAPSSTNPSADRRARTEARADRLQQMALSNLRKADQEYRAREQASQPTAGVDVSSNPASPDPPHEPS